MNTVRTIRYQGFIVREADVVNYLVLSHMERAAAERHASKAPTWDGKPMNGSAFIEAMARSNREDELWSMSQRD